MLPIQQIKQIQDSGRPIPISDISFHSSSKILVLAPHPDDFDEVAVTLRYFSDSGHSILLLVLTGASSGVLDSYCTPPTKTRKEDIREDEQLNALKFFGFPPSNVRFLRMPEDSTGQFIFDAHSRNLIGDLFREFDPDVVSLPYGVDTNISHQRTFELFRELASQASKPILGLCHKDPKTTDITIHAYFPFDQSIAEWKAEMLRFHQSQHTRNLLTRNYGIDERILQVNRALARQLGVAVPYAEGFQLVLINALKSTA